VDACAAKVEPAGGKVAAPPFDIPGIGRMCVIIDPQGAALALMTPSPQMSAG
jgi:predicted enzyme related to lactoylglutathione lyase